MTLRNRFAAFFVTFSVVVSALGGVLSWTASKRALEEQLDEQVRSLAEVSQLLALRTDDLLLLLEPGQEPTPHWIEFQQVLRWLTHTRPASASAREGPYVDRADIFRWRPDSLDARVLVTAEPHHSVPIGQRLSWVRPYIRSGVVQEALDRGYATSPLFEGLDGQQYKYGILRLRSGEAFLGLRYRADYLDPVRTLGWWLVVLSSVSALLGALIGWRLADGIVARLELLSRGALRIQRGLMDRPFELKGEDELARLARAMERMRAGIQSRDEQLRLMLSQVAHEIRNPLGGLELFAAAAGDTEDPEERRRILGRVRQEIRGLNAIIDEFLGFARPEQSRRQLHDVRGPVGEAVSLAEAEMKKAGGCLRVSLGSTPLLAHADARQVKRLILNLLRNASHAGDTVWVEGRMERGEVCITIRDNGPGIPETLRDRIFEPFVGDKAQGAGLGLAIVKELVRANDGRVTLSSPGEGAGDDGRSRRGAEFQVYLGGGEELPAGGRQPG